LVEEAAPCSEWRCFGTGPFYTGIARAVNVAALCVVTTVGPGAPPGRPAQSQQRRETAGARLTPPRASATALSSARSHLRQLDEHRVIGFIRVENQFIAFARLAVAERQQQTHHRQNNQQTKFLCQHHSPPLDWCSSCRTAPACCHPHLSVPWPPCRLPASWQLRVQRLAASLVKTRTPPPRLRHVAKL